MEEIKKCIICKNTNKLCNSEIGLVCHKHYLQFKKHGKILTRTRYDTNEIIENSNGFGIISLYNKDAKKVAESLFDLEDINLIRNSKWCLDKNGYIKNSKHEYLHRIVMNESNQYVDHINGNTLDNRKSNLRICSNSDNLKNRVKLPKNNTSGILGVRFRPDRNKWYSEIHCNNQKINLGSYTNKEDAIKARIEAEIKYFGEYKSKILNNENN